jgi:hypothetical protein
MRFEPMIPVFVWVKASCAFHWAAIVIALTDL